MKKVIAIFAIASLVACGGGVSNNPTADSTKVSTDTTIKTVDTTATVTDTITTK